MVMNSWASKDGGEEREGDFEQQSDQSERHPQERPVYHGIGIKHVIDVDDEKLDARPVTRGPKKRHANAAQATPAQGSAPYTPTSFSPGSTVASDETANRSGATASRMGIDAIIDHDRSSSLTGVFSPHTHDETQTKGYATDCICPRGLILMMMHDFLERLYATIPVLHRPSFRDALARNRDGEDTVFLGLLIAMCATVVGIMPSKFRRYREHGFAFESRKAFVLHCYSTLSSIRGVAYFDEISFNKFAISYLMDIALFQAGLYNLSRMAEVECIQLGRLLHLHKVEEYAGLNQIETQLRKKGFWMLFYSFVHAQVQNLRKERLMFLDPLMVENMDPEALMPLDVDDENIFESHILPRRNDEPCLTTGYIIHSRVFWLAIHSWQSEAGVEHSKPCYCEQTRDKSKRVDHLTQRVCDLKYSLDALPAELRPWASQPHRGNEGPQAHDAAMRFSQFASMRANLHVTHLWLQSILLDQIDSLLHGEPDGLGEGKPLATLSARWTEREAISSQLLHVLHAISPEHIEPNGLHLAYKVRDVAVGLLSCPFEPHEPAFVRAAEYVRSFTAVLATLDTSEIVSTTNLQTWIDTDRERGRKADVERATGMAMHGWDGD
ncbi:hypothetical protein B0A48_04237 [Cryoendolithus antarcticus]|uniref:Transcription factor domain-containing protein n=1 Tax=Cryoendolithus antarcticus TaxID=1507870 RepID=A0A1V8TES3_9PEZI|nr:hypothetical protein B0A48_04237 [Cryoendolithus antarcticus]